MKGYTREQTYYKYEKEGGKLRLAGGSWSVNLADMELDKVNTIKVITSYANYSISIEDAMTKGFQRTFKGEHKLVIPIKYFNIEFKEKEN
jgi:hypothetical protein